MQRSTLLDSEASIAELENKIVFAKLRLKFIDLDDVLPESRRRAFPVVKGYFLPYNNTIMSFFVCLYTNIRTKYRK